MEEPETSPAKGIEAVMRHAFGVFGLFSLLFVATSHSNIWHWTGIFGDPVVFLGFDCGNACSLVC
jgi:hypothetical protein